MSNKTEVLPITLDDGNVLFASVTILGGEEDVVAHGFSFEGAVDVITSIGKQLSGAFDTICPQKAKVEFGIKLSAKAGRTVKEIENNPRRLSWRKCRCAAKFTAVHNRHIL